MAVNTRPLKADGAVGLKLPGLDVTQDVGALRVSHAGAVDRAIDDEAVEGRRGVAAQTLVERKPTMICSYRTSM